MPQNTPHPCGQCDFYTQSVWNPVEGGAVSLLSKSFSRKELPAGQALFSQGTPNRGVFCVSKGLLAQRIHNEDGTGTLLKLAYPGDVIGFRSFIADDMHRTEATALLPSRVCTVAHRDAQNVVHGNPSVLARLAARAVAEIERNQDRINAAATVSNKDRLLTLLQKLMAFHGTADGPNMRMRLPLSRTDIADLIGVQPETLSRLFAKLKADGLCQTSGRDVQIPLAACLPQNTVCPNVKARISA